jgi:hypothetical protein
VRGGTPFLLALKGNEHGALASTPRRCPRLAGFVFPLAVGSRRGNERGPAAAPSRALDAGQMAACCCATSVGARFLSGLIDLAPIEKTKYQPSCTVGRKSAVVAVAATCTATAAAQRAARRCPSCLAVRSPSLPLAHSSLSLRPRLASCLPATGAA